MIYVSNIRSYLYTIARNECYDYLRLTKRVQNIPLDELPVTMAVAEHDIEEQMIETEMIHLYNKAVEELPEKCKLIFLMARQDKLKHREIADILSISTGTVEQQMNIAIRKITDLLATHYPHLLIPSINRKKLKTQVG